MKKLMLTLLFFVGMLSVTFGKELTLNDLQVKEDVQIKRHFASAGDTGLMNSRNLAWATVAMLGMTALTGRHGKASPEHISLTALSSMSYGMFLNSYIKSDRFKGADYKWAGYSKWLHIPAMLLVPVAGAIAQRDFARGKTEAEGLGKLHKPAALGSLVGMALATLSLTFKF